MTTLRTTAIMKTDISGSTPPFRALAEADLTLGDVLHEQGALVGDAVVLAARIESMPTVDVNGCGLGELDS